MVILVVMLLAIPGCASSKTTPAASSAAPAPATTTQVPVKTSAPAATSAAAPASSATSGTLKVGLVAWLGWPVGLDMKRGIEVMADMINTSGGLEVGGQKYQIQLVEYDSNLVEATEVAAVNRLVFQDKVSFIMTDGMFMPAWMAVTEENKVVVMANAPNDVATLSSNLKYCFDPTFFHGLQDSLEGWYAKTYPEKAANMYWAYPDNQQGHTYATMDAALWKSFNVTVNDIFYPATAQDLSALGTKVATSGAQVFGAVGGGASDATAYKAVYQAGFRGQFFSSSPASYTALSQMIPAEILEGYINGAYPTEFEPALSTVAKDFKAAFIARNGKWEDPEIQGTGSFACLVSAWQKAGSFDTDKIADIVSNGFKFEGPTGSGQMVPRLDLGSNRTVDSVAATYVKQITDGKVKLIATISLADAMGYFSQAHPAK